MPIRTRSSLVKSALPLLICAFIPMLGKADTRYLTTHIIDWDNRALMNHERSSNGNRIGHSIQRHHDKPINYLVDRCKFPPFKKNLGIYGEVTIYQYVTSFHEDSFHMAQKVSDVLFKNRRGIDYFGNNPNYYGRSNAYYGSLDRDLSKDRYVKCQGSKVGVIDNSIAATSYLWYRPQVLAGIRNTGGAWNVVSSYPIPDRWKAI